MNLRLATAFCAVVLVLTLKAPGSISAQPIPPSPPPEAERARAALRLPEVADRLRAVGVPDDEVVEALEAIGDNGLDAKHTIDALEPAVQAADAHGPVENFGEFVQQCLEDGLRGPALAEMIRREHAERGRPGRADDGSGARRGPPDGVRSGRGSGDGRARGHERRRRVHEGSGARRGPPADRGSGPHGGRDAHNRRNDDADRGGARRGATEDTAAPATPPGRRGPQGRAPASRQPHGSGDDARGRRGGPHDDTRGRPAANAPPRGGNE